MSTGPIPCFFDEVQLAFRPQVGGAPPHAHAAAIVEALAASSDRFDLRSPSPLPPNALGAHAPGLVSLYRASRRLRPGSDARARVFQPPGAGRRSTVDHIGDWAFDDRSPLCSTLWGALRSAAACALTAASALDQHPLTYAICHPGGHHAGPDRFGGGSYVNQAALAALALKGRGPGVVLDIAAHHGNGTQAFFYDNPDVLYVSVHQDPRSAYPHVSGFLGEMGAGQGRGRNLNLPQAPGCDGAHYHMVLDGHVAPMIRSFGAAWMVLSMGVDTHADAPGSDFTLTDADLHGSGRRIGRFGLPVVVIHEGGSAPPDVGAATLALLDGLREGQALAGDAGVAS